MGLLESYKKFTPVDFIKDLKKHKKRKQELLEKLDELTGLPSIENKSGVKSTRVSDMTANQAIQRAKIQEEIDEIERCEAAHNYALSKLSEQERKLFEGFFEPKIPIWEFRMNWSESHYISESLVYKHRNQMLKKYAENIKKYMGG